MEHYYTPPDQVSGTHLTIAGDEFSHLIHVMRKQPGDELHVVDGTGNLYRARIETVESRRILCAILSHEQPRDEPPCRLTLAVGLLKQTSRFDMLVEKCTELGVFSIVPLITERTIARGARSDRWHKIALAAMKQSGRSVLPAILNPVTFQDFLQTLEPGSDRLIAHEAVVSPGLNAHTALLQPRAYICIGPEGGFSEGEIRGALEAGFTTVGMGGRRLRTETAAIVAVALLLQK
jgi:16S rRNA (uracil1498-N3)-methyltransferase